MTYPTAEQALHVRSTHYLNVMAFHPDGIWAWISGRSLTRSARLARNSSDSGTPALDIPDPEAPETWKFQLMTSWRKSEDDEKDSSRAVGLADVKMKYEGFAEPFRSANAWVPDRTPVYANRVTYWEPFPWDNHGGKVSLAGDAAHPMTFRKLHAGLEPQGIGELTKVLQTVVKASTMRLQMRQTMSPPFEQWTPVMKTLKMPLAGMRWR